jgi:hypothetical protein
MAQNQRRNLEEGRIALAQVIARKEALPVTGVPRTPRAGPADAQR